MGGDVLALGRNGNAPWRVGIVDPRGGVLAGVLLADGEALFSSGDYNKYRSDNELGTRLPHIINPLTGRPTQGTASTAVLHRDPVLADVAATTLMVAGRDGLESNLRKLGIRCALLPGDDATLYIPRAISARHTLIRTPTNTKPAQEKSK